MNMYENRRLCGWPFYIPLDPLIICIWDVIGSRLFFFFKEVLCKSGSNGKMLNLASVAKSLNQKGHLVLLNLIT